MLAKHEVGIVRAMRAVLVALLVAACGRMKEEVTQPHVDPSDPTLSSLSAGAIGCSPTEIQIAEYRSVVRRLGGAFADEIVTWSATCRGRRFYCTGSRTTQCHDAIGPDGCTSSPAMTAK